MHINRFIRYSMVMFFSLMFMPACDPDPGQCNDPMPTDHLSMNDPTEGDTVNPGLVNFTWTNKALSCRKDRFDLNVWKASDSDINTINSNSVTVSTRNTSAQYPTPVEPGEMYFWSLTYVRESDIGPDIRGYNFRGSFWTGPLCSTLNELSPAIITSPQNGQMWLDNDPKWGNYVWEDPNSCHLGNFGRFRLQIGADSNFNTILFSAGPYPKGSDITFAGWGEVPCKVYYFRVITEFEDNNNSLYSDTKSFSFYPTNSILPVTLISPIDHANIPAEDLNFNWQESTDCNRIFQNEIQVSEQEDFSSFAYQMNSRVLDQATMERPKPELEHCTLYYWRIMTDPPGDLANVYSETRSFVLIDPAGPCPIQIPQLTPFTYVPLMPTSTPTFGINPPILTAQENLNCRSGPGPVYGIDDTLMKGKSALVEGRNEDSSWWYIFLENHKVHCWVWGAKVQFDGDINQVRILEAPPTPTLTEEPTVNPVDCSKLTNERKCVAIPTCKWVPSVTTAPYCTYK
jgi:hypothetical protein